MEEKADENPPTPDKEKNVRYYRALVAYWMLGLCNNYGYVVMLSAANDILHRETKDLQETKSNVVTRGNEERACNYMSTGTILLADVVPSLLIKLVAPFLPFFINIRAGICVILAAGGLLFVAFSEGYPWMSILGVIITSFASGLGEVSYLQYSSFYSKNVVSTWSSGTGGAGIAGALSYAALHSLGLRNALLIMLVVPAMMAISYFFILPKPEEKDDVIDMAVQRQINEEEIKDPMVAFKKKLKLIPGLMKFMIPLGLVYLFEYFINQGTFELVNFENWIYDHKEQYRWLQVDYQIGVFISRSSVNIIHIKHIWLMAVLQFLNVIIFTTEVIFYYIPSFWIILALVFWEGLLGGAAYVNTFYKISTDVREEDKQFSMGTTSFADTIGITLAGILAISVHNSICDLPKPERLTF